MINRSFQDNRRDRFTLDREAKTMTIDEAISNLAELSETLHYYHSATMKEAIKLGIEALKQHRALRRINPISQEPLLPGETEE